jgi:hypothetical protein
VRVRSLAFVAPAVLAGCIFKLPEVSDVTDAPTAGDAPDAPDAPPVAACPSGYGPINGIGMYRAVEPGNKSWQDAAADCNDDDDTGGPYSGYTHLVVLGGETERIAITSGTTPISGNTWIGLSDLETEGTYLWVTAEPTGGYPMVGMQPPWDTDDPDNAGGNEDCIRFKNSFVLEDKPCTNLESYVCECDAFPPR